jgi:hypothetical protein
MSSSFKTDLSAPCLIEQYLKRSEAGPVKLAVAPACRGLRSHDSQEFFLPVDVAPLQAEALAGAHPAIVAEDQRDIHPPVLRSGLGDCDFTLCSNFDCSFFAYVRLWLAVLGALSAHS